MIVSQEERASSALALSGGGYRASLFHLGALWRLNELGLLGRLNCIAGVSGGAIVAAWLGLRWAELDFDAKSVSRNFVEEVVNPLKALCSRALDIPAGLAGFLSRGSTLAYGLARHLFGAAVLGDLPSGADQPGVCLLATNLLTGSLVEMSAGGIHDERLGSVPYQKLPLATAVAASCSLPPTFKPVAISIEPGSWAGGGKPELERIRQQRIPLRLVDGGNYDNLGLTAVWDKYATLLVSDGSSPMPPWTWISSNWLVTTLRSNRILIDQLRAVRKRLLIEHKINDPQSKHDGAYWGIYTPIESHGLAGAMTRDSKATRDLGTMRTRLGRHTAEEQGRLINWGYAQADAALRKSKQQGAGGNNLVADRPPPKWPAPEHAL
ncbi:patatin-like phospholipase family protein [bacterium]|nr:patatin-like phospholipase family protein [bacterium]